MLKTKLEEKMTYFFLQKSLFCYIDSVFSLLSKVINSYRRIYLVKSGFRSRTLKSGLVRKLRVSKSDIVKMLTTRQTTEKNTGDYGMGSLTSVLLDL